MNNDAYKLKYLKYKKKYLELKEISGGAMATPINNYFDDQMNRLPPKLNNLANTVISVFKDPNMLHDKLNRFGNNINPLNNLGTDLNGYRTVSHRDYVLYISDEKETHIDKWERSIGIKCIKRHNITQGEPHFDVVFYIVKPGDVSHRRKILKLVSEIVV